MECHAASCARKQAAVRAGHGEGVHTWCTPSHARGKLAAEPTLGAQHMRPRGGSVATCSHSSHSALMHLGQLRLISACPARRCVRVRVRARMCLCVWVGYVCVPYLATQGSTYNAGSCTTVCCSRVQLRLGMACVQQPIRYDLATRRERGHHGPYNLEAFYLHMHVAWGAVGMRADSLKM